MAEIILDLGSGNTCKNYVRNVFTMIDEIAKIDTGKHEVVFKMQLFNEGSRKPNVALDHEVFGAAYYYARSFGYEMTASVFDLESLKFLLSFEDLPFIKVANDRNLDYLIGYIPRAYFVYKSVGSLEEWNYNDRDPKSTYLYCVSKYPADISDYPMVAQISDHTVGLELFHKADPLLWEKHLKLPDSAGLDAGDFAVTPKELEAIL